MASKTSESGVPESRRTRTLQKPDSRTDDGPFAGKVAEDGYRLDIVLQGEDETVFLEF